MHKNKINGKIYIGQTGTSVNKRWQNGKGYKGCLLFERAINKYGWDNFEHIIVADNLTKEESSKMEKDLIALYHSNNPQKGYNISIGGESGSVGVPRSDEHRKRISEAQTGKVMSQETRNKISSALKGRAPSNLALQRASETHNIGVVQLTKEGEYINEYLSAAEAERLTGVDAETIRLCCNSKRGAKSAGGFIWVNVVDYDNNKSYVYKHKRHRPVVQLTKNGEYISEFSSCAEAAKSLGKDSSKHISSCLSGKQKSAYGFIWVEKDKYNPNIDYTYKKELYNNQYEVAQFDKNGNVVAVFDSVKNASRSTGINYCSICECCNGTQKTAGGFVWRRAKDIK